jgi:hypothetical protein
MKRIYDLKFKIWFTAILVCGSGFCFEILRGLASAHPPFLIFWSMTFAVVLFIGGILYETWND